MPSLPRAFSARAAAAAALLAPQYVGFGSAAEEGTAADCGIWLGPSPIKEAEEHGWGHSVFTGRFVPEGTLVFAGGILQDELKFSNTKDVKRKSFGDLFVPVYDWEELDMGAYAAETDDDDDEEDDDQKRLAKRAINRAADAHSMLFQETWNGDDFPSLALESHENMRVYMPGLASLCPCTADGYNLEQVKRVNYRDWRTDIKEEAVLFRDERPPSPQAGSFSYHSNAMFVATRDIPVGEELVVECEGNPDEFDPADYPRSTFRPADAGGYSVCLDDRVEERLADHTPNVASRGGGQRGLFAKRKLSSGEVLTSTPMIPVHRKETAMDDMMKRRQLLLNYMFGHPESSLLWLPQSPLILAANHHAVYDHGTGERSDGARPNAKIRWHHDKYTDAQAAGKPLTRRQQFHHAELLEMDSLEVTRKHGMGLMIDLVATRDIDEGEEVLLDYGPAWDDAMSKHIVEWNSAISNIQKTHQIDKDMHKRQRKLDHDAYHLKELELKKRAANGLHGEGGLPLDGELHHHRQREVGNALTAVPFSSYVTASDYNEMYANEDIRTVSEQRRDPYPSNLETACHFEYDWLDDGINDDPDAERVTYESWYNQNDHFDSTCLLPCIVTERRDYAPGEEKTAGGDRVGDNDADDEYERELRELDDDFLTNSEYGGSFSSKRYTAKLVDTHEENTSINFQCHIYKRFEYIYMDIPREGIVFVNRPHSTDQWIDRAFRQPLGLPEEMVPANWRDLATARPRKGMRGSPGPGQTKPKPKNISPPLTEKEEEEEKEYQLSVKRWNYVETRRERLEETEMKRDIEFSPWEDL